MNENGQNSEKQRVFELFVCVCVSVCIQQLNHTDDYV